MCGIVGLFIKNPKLEAELGALLAQMLAVLSDRGPDSAGFAVYGEARPGFLKITLRAGAGYDFAALAARLRSDLRCAIALATHDTHAVLDVPAQAAAELRAHLAVSAPEVVIVGSGNRMRLFKDIGLPGAVAERLGLERMTGTHAIGHTRMATESAVTIAGAHPFSTGSDQCLVHNGSLSNHNALRRELVRGGMTFATENDSEVAAAYLTQRMRAGRSLEEALTDAIADLDGFYTFVVGTQTGFAVLRDPIACKPAVLAETADYVAFGTEYRALADLPGIGAAKLWEPEPATVYVWS
jgi:glutamate synthase domain-containing protein 1